MKEENKVKVLHLEDDPDDSELVLTELGTLAFEIDYTRVDCEKNFRYQLENNQFDIILADYNLPTFNGISALRICSEKYPDIPFIIVSGTLGEDIAVQTLKYGASDYLLKQNLKRLASSVEHSLEEARLKLDKIKAEKDLKESEEKYRSIFENIQDVYYRINNDGIITEISPSIQRLSGYNPHELIGKPSSIFYSYPEERDLLLQKLSKNNEVWDYEVRMKTKEGIIKYTSLNAHLIFNTEGIPNGIEGSLRDIDERKHFELQLEEAKEKAEESDRLKTAFLHNISHEIRTPMNAIIGFSSILAEEETTTENQKSYINSIQDGSNQLLSIINDIVDISSIEANILKKSITKVNVNDILMSLYNQFQLKAYGNNNSLKVSPGLRKEDAFLDTDNTKLIQILSNLVNNALKFTKNGKVEFGYKVDASMIEFFISDTGIGIAKDQYLKIFSNFYQVENELSRQYGGTGLGLAISKAYTELLGGKIWLQSEPGKGSTFYFNIPYINSQPEVQRKKEIREFPDFSFKQAVLILVAEDDDQNFNLILHQLSDPQLKIIRAMNGSEAVDLCKSHNFDLILMDLKMPVMDGYTATRKIKEHYPHLPVIAQTAFFTDKENVKTFGCDDFISKPFTREEILSMVHKHLKINE